MAAELNLSSEVWNILRDEGDGADTDGGGAGWENISDKRVLRDLWDASTYQLHEVLHSVKYTVNDNRTTVSRIAFSPDGPNRTTGDNLSVLQVSSVTFGKCAVIKTHGPRPTSIPSLEVTVR